MLSTPVKSTNLVVSSGAITSGPSSPRADKSLPSPQAECLPRFGPTQDIVDGLMQGGDVQGVFGISAHALAPSLDIKDEVCDGLPTCCRSISADQQNGLSHPFT